MARRLRIYLFGVGLGLLLTWALVLRHRNTEDLLAWTPENRVLNALREDTALQKPDQYICLLDCYDLTSLDVEALLNDGAVDFSKSQTKTDPKEYLVQYALTDERVLSAWFAFEADSTHRLTRFYTGEEPQSCPCPNE